MNRFLQIIAVSLIFCCKVDALPEVSNKVKVFGVSIPCTNCQLQTSGKCLVYNFGNVRKQINCEELLQDYLKDASKDLVDLEQLNRIEALLYNTKTSHETKKLAVSFLKPKQILTSQHRKREVPKQIILDKPKVSASMSTYLYWSLPSILFCLFYIYIKKTSSRIDPALVKTLAKFGLTPGVSTETLRGRYKSIARSLHSDTTHYTQNFSGDLSKLVKNYREAKRLIEEHEKKQ